MMTRCTGFVVGLTTVALAANTVALERQWEIRLQNVFGGGTKPLSLYARDRDGVWGTVMGASIDPENPRRRTFNQSDYVADFSGVRVADGKLAGTMTLHITPDEWVPSDHKPFTVDIELDAAVTDGGAQGTYKVVSVSSTDKSAQTFVGLSGSLLGGAKEVPPAEFPEQLTLQLNLQGALVGGDPKIGSRCMVLRLGFDGDRLVSTTHGQLSKKREVYNELAVPQAEDAVTRRNDEFKGSIVFSGQDLDMQPVTYRVDLNGGLVATFAVGTYTVVAEAEGAEPLTVRGSFDGKWTEGVEIPESDPLPWYSATPGFVMPEKGEHPRLLFRKSDLPALREKAHTPEGQAILTRLRRTLDGADAEEAPAPGQLTIGHIAGYGLLYQLTGDARYAALAKVCFERTLAGEKDVDARYSFKNPSGALRAGPALGWTAVGYDLCYDAWDEQTRERFGRAIAEYNEIPNYADIETLTRGTHPPGSNHFGLEVGGAILALLAVNGESFVDQARMDKLLKIAEISTRRNLTEGFGDGGFFAEGDGTGSMSSQIAFISGLQAWKNAMGRDYINVERPNARMMTLKWIYLTIVRDGKPDFWPKRGGYPHNVWARENLSGGGYFAIGMAGVTDEQKAAMKWYYNQFLLGADQSAGAPFDTVSRYPHIVACSFINWPLDIEARNPAQVLPHCYRDTVRGFVAWRNRWQDDNDVVISVLLRESRGYHGAEPDGSLQIMGYGQKFSWSKAMGDVDYWWQDERGTVSVITTANISTGVDFSKLSGADVLLATTAGGDGITLQVSAGEQIEGTPFRKAGQSITLKFLPEVDKPTPVVEGGKVVVGRRTIALVDGNLVFGER